MNTARRVVVVGSGMAGTRFVQEVVERDLDRRLSITVVGDEPGDPYNRMLLSDVLAGATSADNIVLADRAWYDRHRVGLRTATSAVRIDRAARLVHLDDGTALGYDVLVLATGSSAVRPPVDGLHDGTGGLRRGALALRTLADCREIDRLAAGAGTAVVLGAGVLGLEAARGLAGRGLAVTLLQRGTRLMERQLDAGASRLLTRTARSLGVTVRTGSAVGIRECDGRVAGVQCDDGSVVDAELLVLCCGVRPRVELARAAGLAVAAGVVVDDQLRSVTDPAVFAIGECAEHRGRTYGLVAPVWEQARAAAQAVAQPERPISYAGSPEVTRLKAAGLELACLGDSTAEPGESDDDIAGPDVIRFADSGRGVYQKLVVTDGRLTGAILLGDTRAAGTLTQLFDRGAALPADRAGLLIARRNAPVTTAQTPTALPGRTTICQCNGVTKARICTAWQDGARSIPEIATATRATTGCGTCRDTVEGLLDWLAAADTDPRVALDAPDELPTAAVPA